MGMISMIAHGGTWLFDTVIAEYTLNLDIFLFKTAEY